MTPADLAQLIPGDLDIDLEARLAEYEQRHGSQRPHGFVDYLYEQRLIDEPLYARLCAALPLKISLRSADDARRVALTMGERPTAIAADEPEVRLLESPSAVSSPADEPATERPGTATEPPRYVLLGPLGKGATSQVHVARDVYLRRRVAFKHLATTVSGDPGRFSRFLAEMQITAQLDHPNIVPVYGLEVAPDGAIAYAMRLAPGRDLAQLLAETRQRVQQGERLDEEHGLAHRLDCFLKVCDAVALAHDRGVVHRDLKPTHIMIGGHGEVYVMDWGIARPMGGGEVDVEGGTASYDPAASADDVARTRVGKALGTPRYMSPEQAAGRNEELDGRSDQYTLGLILQELVTLERAVPGSTLREVCDHARRGTRAPLRPNAAGIAVPRELEAIIDRATQRRRVRRYRSVADMATDLRRYLRGDEVHARPDGPVQRMARWLGKHRSAALAVIALDTVVAIAAVVVAAVAVDEQGVTEAQRRRTGDADSAALRPATPSRPPVASSPRSTAPDSANDAPSRGVPDDATVPTVTLEVVPSFASVTVDGVARQVVDGQVQLRSPVGSKHRVVVTVAGEASTYEVTITERGPRPWQVRAVQLRPGAGAEPGPGDQAFPYEPTPDPYD